MEAIMAVFQLFLDVCTRLVIGWTGRGAPEPGCPFCHNGVVNRWAPFPVSALRVLGLTLMVVGLGLTFFTLFLFIAPFFTGTMYTRFGRIILAVLGFAVAAAVVTYLGAVAQIPYSRYPLKYCKGCGTRWLND